MSLSTYVPPGRWERIERDETERFFRLRTPAKVEPHQAKGAVCPTCRMRMGALVALCENCN